MQFKKGYDSRDYVKDGQKVYQTCSIQGKRYGRGSTELLDRVGRVIGYRVETKLYEIKPGKTVVETIEEDF